MAYFMWVALLYLQLKMKTWMADDTMVHADCGSDFAWRQARRRMYTAYNYSTQTLANGATAQADLSAYTSFGIGYDASLPMQGTVDKSQRCLWWTSNRLVPCFSDSSGDVDTVTSVFRHVLQEPDCL